MIGPYPDCLLQTPYRVAISPSASPGSLADRAVSSFTVINPLYCQSMLQLARALASLWMLLVATGTHAQAPYPPQALALAPSVDAAVRSLSVVRPEFSGYLLLDVPEISLSGVVKAQLRSELPGTSQLVLLREFPISPDGAPSVQQKSPGRTAANPARRLAPTRPSAPPTVFVAAKLIEPGEAPVLTARFDFQRNERFTLLAYAQGRWFATSREIKLAKEVEAP